MFSPGPSPHPQGGGAGRRPPEHPLNGQESQIKDATKATIRCLALPGQGPEPETGKCVLTGAPSVQRVLFAKNY